ncbi:MAG: hypothetical protein A3I88_03485 [Candidatus Portnoybacteria bacterium RIFCSPLOWO2_12_FULL_39_9]|uniref:Uncharacterized protein n=1 Tax=Candidatus Portnoybacteria bacterium RIFCSPHIGHO2_12_FULL_38_9 TaxID=1801997 RepID=A0A1G2FGS6_9BACT|nr:MAG: hypothetical protein A3H00_02665 [Candidatus Portnoybacteria bacterium RBG_13_40_8]OGZ36129.1 MAG: hypothetical protein A2646_01520 [Candidatus Portnoybacteria bacterium RIFCSPHIGHO2_02_FULL_39_12]OGZ37269.1 MAG: hypothetical protein A3J64_01390 [Candidatus Portnoybacteria bacterium RIFCSPHIGHO2_12_FULL_38_9]OGZ38999.1 MAG: hypothetical protein A3F21_00860 [Candidatus Portnoybacteria bacterium RIFCSPLOWO2_01_FULL_38_39]OGZ40667.1 MAG: hypothetical protein A3I88_03485 [Candidatus Portnoy
MASKITHSGITLSEPAFGEGVVILRRRLYDKMREKIQKLQDALREQREIDEVKKIIEEGERDFREGKLKPIKSLSDLD